MFNSVINFAIFTKLHQLEGRTSSYSPPPDFRRRHLALEIFVRKQVKVFRERIFFNGVSKGDKEQPCAGGKHCVERIWQESEHEDKDDRCLASVLPCHCHSTIPLLYIRWNISFQLFSCRFFMPCSNVCIWCQFTVSILITWRLSVYIE